MERFKIMIPYFLGALLLLISCNNQERKGKDTGSEGFLYKQAKEEQKQESLETLIYSFPSPGDILERFENSDLMYKSELMHPVSLVDNYITRKEKALNLGVYATDLAYAAMFAKNSIAVDYLEAVQSLSNDLNIFPGDMEDLIERADENIGNNDSIIAYSNEVFFNIIENLEDMENKNIVALVSAGAYVESMHIAFQSVDHYSADNSIIRQIAELRYPLKNLLDQASLVSDDSDVKSILNDIQEINDEFDKLVTKGAEIQVKQDEQGVLSLSGEEDKTMDEHSFQILKAKIEAFRKSIIYYE